VDTALATFAGHGFSTSDRELADALSSAGATELRHAHSMSHSLKRLPTGEVNSELELRALPAADIAIYAEALGRISFAAYPPGHPDHEFGDAAEAAEEIRQMGRGEILGPYLDVSRLALRDGRPVGTCLVVDRPGKAPEGGPWIVDVFRDPAAEIQGIGSAVICAALAAAKEAGLPSVSLVVSHTNANAKRLYEHLGFVEAYESWTLALPQNSLSVVD
jgi:RimJ/RimL family protein N-acetyltransferase